MEFLDELKARLAPVYTPANSGTNGMLHIQRIIDFYPQVASIERLSFDKDEYIATALLHEIDKSAAHTEEIDEFVERNIQLQTGRSQEEKKNLRKIFRQDKIRLIVFDYIAPSPFSLSARVHILDTVQNHPKYWDDLKNDSHLMTAFRITDKIVRMGTLGLIDAAGNRGRIVPIYDPKNPFAVKSTAEENIQSVFNDWVRTFEWYGMLPFDEARALVPEYNFRQRIAFFRQLGKEIGEATGQDGIAPTEQRLKEALGQYYERFI